jgi:hypothetical protein
MLEAGLAPRFASSRLSFAWAMARPTAPPPLGLLVRPVCKGAGGVHASEQGAVTERGMRSGLAPGRDLVVKGLVATVLHGRSGGACTWHTPTCASLTAHLSVPYPRLQAHIAWPMRGRRCRCAGCRPPADSPQRPPAARPAGPVLVAPAARPACRPRSAAAAPCPYAPPFVASPQAALALHVELHRTRARCCWPRRPRWPRPRSRPLARSLPQVARPRARCCRRCPLPGPHLRPPRAHGRAAPWSAWPGRPRARLGARGPSRGPPAGKPCVPRPAGLLRPAAQRRGAPPCTA